MNEAVKNRELKEKIAQDYEWGFSSDIEQEFAPKGLSEDTVRFISAKKDEPEWMLEWRLKAYHAWLEMEEVDWAKRVVETFESNPDSGVLTLDGKMLDKPHLTLARRLLGRTGG